MKINRYLYVALLAVAATLLSAVLVFAMSGRSLAAGAIARSKPPVDANGHLHVPSNYREAYEYLDPGRSLPTAVRDRNRFTKSMRRRGRSRRIARQENFPTAPRSSRKFSQRRRPR